MSITEKFQQKHCDLTSDLNIKQWISWSKILCVILLFEM